MKNLLILVDGLSCFYRFYYALSDLINRDGQPVGAIYGTLNMLIKLLSRYEPSDLIVIFDNKNNKTFRKKLFSEYKSHRLPTPMGLRNQISEFFNIIRDIGISYISVEAVEADDVIGTLAFSEFYKNRFILISTDDKDMTQLVSSRVSLINTNLNRIMGSKEVQLKFGVPPNLIVDYLTLIGDKSDNIPGIPWIGKKTAKMLLDRFCGGIEDLYKNIDSIRTLKLYRPEIVLKSLKKHQEMAFLFYRLITIKKDVELDINFDQFRIFKIEKIISSIHQYKLKIND